MTLLDLGELALVAIVHGTALAALTAVLVATVLPRARPALLVSLWTIVLLKFVLPVGPTLPLSLSGLLESALGATAGRGTVSAAASAPGAALPAPASGAASWLALLLATLYLGGVVVLAARRWRRHRVIFAAASRIPPAPSTVALAVARVGQKLGLARVPSVRVCDAAPSAYVVGAFAPILVVPRWLSERPAQLEAALCHELAHVRRRDGLLRGLQLLVSTALFFWPVVHWVNRRIDRAREMACDQWAIAHGPLSPRDYSALLLGCARRAASLVPVPALALMGRPTELEERIRAIVTDRVRPRPRLGGVSGLGTVAYALLSLGGAGTGVAAARAVPVECIVEGSVVEQIIARYPEADEDGDGALSRREICAHHRRMQERAIDRGQRPGDVALKEIVRAAPDRGRSVGNGAFEAADSVATGDLAFDPIECHEQVCDACECRDDHTSGATAATFARP